MKTHDSVANSLPIGSSLQLQLQKSINLEKGSPSQQHWQAVPSVLFWKPLPQIIIMEVSDEHGHCLYSQLSI